MASLNPVRGISQISSLGPVPSKINILINTLIYNDMYRHILL